jgi:hypothetical protein
LNNSSPDALRNALLLCISKGRRNGVYIDDMLSYGDYDSVQEALMWLEGKGLVSADHLKEIGNRCEDVLRATITIPGIDYITNGFSLPIPKVSVTLDEEQLERIIIGMARKFGKPDDSSRIKKFIEKTGNAGINALATESVKYMIAHLPEIAKGLM